MSHPCKETVWKHYDLITNTQTEYLKIILNLNIFYYGVTGAIVSFKYSRPDIPVITLLLPTIMGLFFGVTLLIFAWRNQQFLEPEAERCATHLFPPLSEEDSKIYDEWLQSEEVQRLPIKKRDAYIKKKTGLDNWIYWISTDPTTYGAYASGGLMLLLGVVMALISFNTISLDSSTSSGISGFSLRLSPR